MRPSRIVSAAWAGRALPTGNRGPASRHDTGESSFLPTSGTPVARLTPVRTVVATTPQWGRYRKNELPRLWRSLDGGDHQTSARIAALTAPAVLDGRAHLRHATSPDTHHEPRRLLWHKSHTDKYLLALSGRPSCAGMPLHRAVNSESSRTHRPSLLRMFRRKRSFPEQRLRCGLPAFARSLVRPTGSFAVDRVSSRMLSSPSTDGAPSGPGRVAMVPSDRHYKIEVT